MRWRSRSGTTPSENQPARSRRYRTFMPLLGLEAVSSLQGVSGETVAISGQHSLTLRRGDRGLVVWQRVATLPGPRGPGPLQPTVQ